MHESEYNLNLLKPLSSNITTQQPAWSNNLKRFYFDYTETESENLKRKLEKSGFDINSNYIIIHPGSKSSAKDLPLNKLNNYINRFLKNISDFKIVITGTKEEKTISEKIISSTDENSNGRIFSFIDCLTLKELLILIDKSKLFISNSTGPLHMAGALNKNIICFFPNSKPMNPERWKPLSENPVIFTPEKDDDMSTINPENIIKSTINILKPFIK
jgi:ADP-heptose:LPS heptosyltransferase